MTTAYRVDAFTCDGEGGNPAGVVISADELSEGKMQAIAADLDYSETAFLMESAVADHRVRFFAPKQEIDLCGHATVASYHLMSEVQGLCAGMHRLETNVGVLEIEVAEDGEISMQQALPVYSEVLDANEIAGALSLEASQFDPSLPAQVVSTGVRKIFAPIASLAALNSIVSDPGKNIEVSKKYGVTGIFAFTLDTPTAMARCRNFSPLVGIFEESATGTSCGALSCYLHHHGLLQSPALNEIVFEQGFTMGQPSRLVGSLQVKDGEVSRVAVSGKATTRDKREVV
jgi:PhzF family phenazine biosynthesis protein